MIDMDPEMSPESKGTSSEGRYRTIEELARKGPLRVVAAHDQLLNRTVAIAFYGGTSAQRSAFTRQSQTVARLASNFVVDIYDCGSHDGLPFVVFERPAYTLSEVIRVRDDVDIAWVGLRGAVGELKEAMACLASAGIELGGLRPEIVGVNGAGHVRLSPWPFASPAAAADAPTLVAGDALSEEEQILAFVAAATIGPIKDREAVRRSLGRGGEAVYPGPFLGAEMGGHLNGPQAEHPSDPTTTTAQMLVDRSVLSRPMVTSHMAKRRRPRSRYLAAAAAIVALAILGTAGALGQGGSGSNGRDLPAAAATSRPGTSTPKQSGSGSGGPPPTQVFNEPANAPSKSRPEAASGQAVPLVTPAANAVSATTVPVAPAGASTPSTTPTTAPNRTTDAPVPTTTPTTAPPTTTTTTTATTTTTTTTTTTVPPTGP